jgi:hypothetical protein
MKRMANDGAGQPQLIHGANETQSTRGPTLTSTIPILRNG